MDILLTLKGKGTGSYEKVKDWGAKKHRKKLDIFKLDEIFIPINISNLHWTLAHIRMEGTLLTYIDSQKSPGKAYTDAILGYLRYAWDEGGMRGEFPKWTTREHTDHPFQRDTCNCGAFVLAFAELLSRGIELNDNSFNLEDIKTMRCRMILTIMQEHESEKQDQTTNQSK